MLSDNKYFKQAEKYRNDSNLAKAIENYKLVLPTVKNNEELIIINQVIGVCYSGLKKPTLARKYLNKALSISNDEKNYLFNANILRDIAMTYTNVDDYEPALPILNKSIIVLQKTNDQNNPVYLATLGITKSRIASTNAELGKFAMAQKIYKEADKLLADAGHSYWRVTNLTSWLMDAYKNDDIKTIKKINQKIHYILANTQPVDDAKLLLKLHITDLYISLKTDNNKYTKIILNELTNDLKRMEPKVRMITFNRFRLSEIISNLNTEQREYLKIELEKLNYLLNDRNTEKLVYNTESITLNS